MPGFDQRGPMNEGPMTGRKMGRCAARSTQDAGGTPEREWGVPGYGRGRSMAMGRGRCQRTWRDMDTAGDPQVSRLSQSAGQDAVAQRVNMLEMELEALKNELEKMNK